MNTPKMAGIIALSGLSATALYAAQPPVASQVQSNPSIFNTAMGLVSLSNDVTPTKTCVPYAFNHSSYYMSGCANTASGIAALEFNTTGSSNTADGAGALRLNTTGFNNTAVGSLAMYNSNATPASGASSVRGSAAFGAGTLFTNTTGYHNSALGAYSLFANTTGSNNTAVGHNAMFSSLTGSTNTAIGHVSLGANTTGNGNTAVGNAAIAYNLSGNFNTGVGAGALGKSATGIGNTGIGSGSGSALASGNYNTYVGYGIAGAAAENYVTRIGVFTGDPNILPFTPAAYISGIYSTTGLAGLPVIVTSNGQLGVQSVSSERFKTDIAVMGGDTSKLSQLRPVTFKYKTDMNGTVQYGLVAEEVAAVYPELVVRDQNGRIDGVRYDELAPMLLNEVQKEQQTISAEEAHIAAQDEKIQAQAQKLARVDQLEQQVAKLTQLNESVQAALNKLLYHDEPVPLR